MFIILTDKATYSFKHVLLKALLSMSVTDWKCGPTVLLID